MTWEYGRYNSQSHFISSSSLLSKDLSMHLAGEARPIRYSRFPGRLPSPRNSCSPQILQCTQLSQLNIITHCWFLLEVWDFSSCPHIKRAASGLTWGVILQPLSKQGETRKDRQERTLKSLNRVDNYQTFLIVTEVPNLNLEMKGDFQVTMI